MNKDEFSEKLLEFTDFAYARFASYPSGSDSIERGKWARAFQALEQAWKEVLDDE